MTAPTFRERVRAQLREAILDAAREHAVERGWRNVRMGDVATTVGVSRQTVYSEFAGKDTLAEAVAFRELRNLLAALSDELDLLDGSLHDVIRDGVVFVLRAADANPVLHAALTGQRPADTELLPLLLKTVEPILAAAQDVLVRFASGRFPDLPFDDLDLAVDALVRLVVSHLVLPAQPPVETGRRVATVITRTLGLTP